MKENVRFETKIDRIVKLYHPHIREAPVIYPYLYIDKSNVVNIIFAMQNLF